MRVLTLWIRVVALTFAMAQFSSAADLCITPDTITAITKAELIFSGKIVEVRAPDGPSEAGYKVRLIPEIWWKGAPTNEVELLWKTSVAGCSYFPVGEVGENYLIYADGNSTEKLPEITAYNRTSKLPSSSGSQVLHLDSGLRFGEYIQANPKLDRWNGSNDVAVLRVLKECSCTSSEALASCPGTGLLAQRATSNAQISSQSACCTCLRRLRF